jgi:hypothetical protein
VQKQNKRLFNQIRILKIYLRTFTKGKSKNALLVTCNKNTQHRLCPKKGSNAENAIKNYQLKYTGNALVEPLKVVHRTQPERNGSSATLF